MKTKETRSPSVAKFSQLSGKDGCQSVRAQRCANRGVALIIVLAFITLATVLVVAFLSSVLSSGVGERAAASETSAAQLAAAAVQLVEATITTATEPTTDTTTAWACQPGMIRTYGTGSNNASADPLAYYKLYSSDNMVISGKAACNQFTDFSQTTSLYTEVPQYWDSAPALYADLNAPLIVLSTGANGTTTSQPIFPIVDPRAKDLQVEGFDYLDSVPLKSTPIDGVRLTSNDFAADTTGSQPSRLPMPVRWMYVLRDGTTTVPDGPGVPTAAKSATASWSTNLPAAAVPTSTNPIVGRVAFWTDDEDAKINVNTASEGTYADMPIANTGVSSSSFVYPQTAPIGDVLLALNQGAQHEYQRYPGHPATTCLSPVFGSALNSLGTLGTLGTSGFRANLVKAITDTIPRITDYPNNASGSGASSMGGTLDPAPNPYPSPPATPPPLVTDKDRLYSSLDEFQFAAPTPAASSPRSTQTLGTAQTAQNLVDTCRFFLTAHSKSPELNLFGLPRVAMWPTWDDASASKRTDFDQEIIHCATIAAAGSNAHRMSFTRLTPASPTTDFNIARNQQVYGYLKTLMGRGIPGFGGNFSAKYGSADLSQILTEIFDYVRCTNLADQSKDGTNGYSYTPSIVPGGTNLNVAVGQVVPTQTGTTHGIGRIGTIAELALVLVKIDDRKDTTKVEGTGNIASSLKYSGDTSPAVSGTIDPTKQTLVEWAILPKFFSPMAGYAGLGNDFRVRFVVSNLKIGDAPVINKPLGTLADEYDIGRLPNSGRAGVTGGLMGVTFLTAGAAPGQSSVPTGLAVISGTNVNCGNVGGGTIQVSGDVDAFIYSPNGSAATGGTPVQTLHFGFPANSPSVPIPKLVYWSGMSATGTFRRTLGWNVNSGAITFNYDTTNSDKGGGTYGRRWDGSLDHFLGDNGGDMVRSLVPIGTLSNIQLNGDLRLIAASQTVPKEAWALAQKNSGTPISGGTPATTTDYQVSNLRDSNYFSYGGGQQGTLFQLVTGQKYGNQRGPEVPPGIAAVRMNNPVDNAPGDWDNGPGVLPDGPYVNKPNEGESPNQSNGAGGMPYIGPNENTSAYYAASSVYFSPNLQISSPVMFGSLPVGVDHPWRTLLFRPANLPGYEFGYTHPGGLNATIRDHLLLDLFWMPVVEPYGVSEPFATSGKINLNTQIAPFTYITRTTGLRAVLKSVMITALNPAQPATTGGGQLVGSYKNGYGPNPGSGQSQNTAATSRYPIEPDQTLSQVTATPINPKVPPADSTPSHPYPEFARSAHTAALPNFFVSASQICDLPLVPQGSNPGSLGTFWRNNIMTGDNSLERPYSLIYPRVTTKSNIFTVHVLAQSLKKIATDPSQNTWNEGKDLVTSEYRGAYTVEKYFDPNTDDITTDAAGTAKSPAAQDIAILNTAAVRNTKWRLLSVKRFGQ